MGEALHMHKGQVEVFASEAPEGIRCGWQTSTTLLASAISWSVSASDSRANNRSDASLRLSWLFFFSGL